MDRLTRDIPSSLSEEPYDRGMPEENPVELRKVFPANVTLPTGDELTDVLAIVTRERVYVWGQQGGAAALRFEARYVDPGRLPHVSELSAAPMQLSVRSEDDTEEGIVVITRSRGCGCGSILRSFRPWSREVAG